MTSDSDVPSLEVFERNLAGLIRMGSRMVLPEGFRLDHLSLPPEKGASGIFSCRRSRQGHCLLQVTLENTKKTLTHPSNPYFHDSSVLSSLHAVRGDTFLLYGIGLGYLPELLHRTFPFPLTVAAIEPSLDVFKLAMWNNDLTLVFNWEGFHLAICPDRNQAYSFFASNYIPYQSRNIHKVEQPYLHLPSVSEHTLAASEGVEDAAAHLSVNQVTKNVIGPAVQRNTLKNLGHGLTSSGHLSLIDSSFKGKPAMIIAPGPSLDKNHHLLTEAMKGSLIIALDTAYKPLIRKNVTPHILISLDPNEINLQKFENEKMLEDIFFFGNLCAYPGVWDLAPAHSFSYLRQPYQTKVYSSYTGYKGAIPPGGSVLTDAVLLAFQLGCDPIVLVGADLAFSDDRWYADGGFRQDRGGLHSEVFEVPSLDGGKVITSSLYYTQLLWLDHAIEPISKNTRLIDATEGGALKKLFSPLPLREVIDTFCRTEFDTAALLLDAWQREQTALRQLLLEPDLSGLCALLRDAADLTSLCRDIFLKIGTGLTGASQVAPADQFTLAAHTENEVLNHLQCLNFFDYFVFHLTNNKPWFDPEELAELPAEEQSAAVQLSAAFWEEFTKMLLEESEFISSEANAPYVKARQSLAPT